LLDGQWSVRNQEQGVGVDQENDGWIVFGIMGARVMDLDKVNDKVERSKVSRRPDPP
jgi:hypothetical protein